MTLWKKFPGISFLRFLFGLMLFICLSFPFAVFGQDSLQPSSTISSKPTVLVIDPGHGGKDIGTPFGDGLLEKDLTLDVAQKIKELITPDTGIKVILTRSGDYELPLENRAAIANHQKAEIFVSIHFSNHLYPAVEELRIYTAAYSPEEMEYFSTTRQSWQSMQSRHFVASRGLSKSMETSARASGSFESVTSMESPVYVLEGASMAAVAVEFGIASTQGAIKKLESDEYRQQIAKTLFEGILAYTKEQE